MIIGLAGYAQTGKNTIADMLPAFEQAAFADTLREMMVVLNPIVEVNTEDTFFNEDTFKRYNDIVAVYGYEWAKAHTTARNFMVKLGAGARELLGEDVWINQVKGTLLNNDHVIVTDVRYMNEVATLLRYGAKIWYVSRPGYGAANEEERSHMGRILESGLVDEVIVNNSGLIDLQDMVYKKLARSYSHGHAVLPEIPVS